MIKFLLDTNVLSEAIKTTPNKNVMRRLKRHQDEIATASPVWHELQYGCKRLPMSKKRELLESYLDEVIWQNLQILPYDDISADWHANQRARLVAMGKTPSFVDGQIASIAAVNKLQFVTRNTTDFCIFEGLSIQNWHDE